MECLPKMTKKQLASLSELLSELLGELCGDESDYGVLESDSFYDKLRLYSDCSMQDMLSYTKLVYEYLLRSCPPMASKYKRLHANLLTVRQRRFAIQTLIARREAQNAKLPPKARRLGCGVPWFPDVYKRVKKAYEDTEHDAVKIVCLMIMGNVTEEEGSLAPVLEETGILRIKDLTNAMVRPKSDRNEYNEYNEYDEYNDGGSFDISDGKLYIGERALTMSEMFLNGVTKLPELSSGYLITDPSGENDRHTYGWLCDVFEHEVGCGIANVRLSYFNWRDMTGAGHAELAEICGGEGYEAVITCDEELKLGDLYAEFLNDCIVRSDDECVDEYEMAECYRIWYEDVHLCCEARGGNYLGSNIERLTGVRESDKGNWWGLFCIDGCDEG